MYIIYRLLAILQLKGVIDLLLLLFLALIGVFIWSALWIIAFWLSY
nr:MAG TPA: hypothetical protein [Caudoviricetes sp.]